MPTRFAIRELKMTYLERVQEETTNFLNIHIKHDFLRPDRKLTLDLTITEAEILISANEEVRDMADSGELKRIHSYFNELTGKVQTEYLAVREQLAKTLQIIEGKENQLYAKLVNELGFENMKLHGEVAPILDALGLSSGDNSFTNLSIIEGALENGHESSDQLRNIRGYLHAYMGVKARLFNVEADLKLQYANLVAKGEGEQPLAMSEYRTLIAAHDNYLASFDRFQVEDFAKAEYDTFIA